MGIVFIGSQPIGHDCLKEILELKISVNAVFTFKPDAHEKWEKSVEEIARENNIPIYFPEELTIEKIKELNPELIVVIGYRKIFPMEILDIPKNGVVGIHASLLPHLRGQAPINWSIIIGDKKTGATLFKMDRGIDTGDIIDQREVIIDKNENISQIKNKITEISKNMIKDNILKILNNSINLRKQPKEGTYGCARIPDDGQIDWMKDAKTIHNLIRASESTYPAFTFLNSEKIYILDASIENDMYYGTPGQVGMTFKDRSVNIISGKGAIRIKKIKKEDGTITEPKNILKNSKIRLG